MEELMQSPLELTEAAIRGAFEAQDLPRAANEILALYGRDVLGFLVARLRNRDDGQEAYAMFSEDLWRGLRGFEFRGSARAWTYTLARNAATRYALAKERRPARNLPLSEQCAAVERAAASRSATQAHLRTEVKQRMRALRDRLTSDEQTLLMLHVDRGLTFPELAEVLHGAPLDKTLLDRETPRIRKQFERIKRKLRQLAIEEGILTDRG